MHTIFGSCPIPEEIHNKLSIVLALWFSLRHFIVLKLFYRFLFFANGGISRQSATRALITDNMTLCGASIISLREFVRCCKRPIVELAQPPISGTEKRRQGTGNLYLKSS